MAMIQKICPFCGGTAQIEDGIAALCPYCGMEFPPDAAQVQLQQGMQFQQMPQDTGMQFQQMPQDTGMQFQQNPVFGQGMQLRQDMPYPQGMQQGMMQQGMPEPENMQYMQQQPVMRQIMQPQQYAPEQLSAAKQKRTSWHLMNAAMFAMQGLILGLGIYLDDWGYDIGVPMILGWLASLFFGAVASAWLRPDEAYLEKKPPFGPKWLYAVIHGLGHLIVTAIIGGILYGILDELFF